MVVCIVRVGTWGVLETRINKKEIKIVARWIELVEGEYGEIYLFGDSTDEINLRNEIMKKRGK